jgi:hypothetical protein
MLFVIKHRIKKDFIKNFILFWTLIVGLLSSIIVIQLFYLILIGIIILLGYELIFTLTTGWQVVPKKKYLFYFPFFKILNYFASAIGYTHGFLLICLEKLGVKKIDWSRV